jgi:flagellar export protein FliJ
MAFRFPLHPLLRLEQSIEKQEELLLLARVSVVDGLRNQIAALDMVQAEQDRAMVVGMMEGSTGAEMHFAAAGNLARTQVRNQLCEELRIAEAKREEQAKAYRAVRRKRETLSSLRDRQRQAYEIESSRREQQRVDEAFLIRHHYEHHD